MAIQAMGNPFSCDNARSPMPTLLTRIVNLGVLPQDEPSLERRVRLTNVTSLLATGIGMGYFTAYAILGLWQVNILNAAAEIGYAFPLWLNARRRHAAAPVCLLSVAIVHLAVLCNVFLGRASGAHYFLIAVVPFSFMMCSRRFWAVLLASAALAAFMISEYLPYDPPLETTLSPLMLGAIRATSMTLTILLVQAVALLFYRDLTTAESALRQAKQSLEQSNERMAMELAAAARVQQALLPAAAPPADGSRFAWVYRPCRELGGDANRR